MRLACLVALLCVACGAGAATPEVRCSSTQTQQAINDCARRNFQAADAALNIAYGEVMERLPNDRRPQLRKEQRTWLAGRDTACKAKVRDSEGGSMWELAFYSCLEAATNQRAEKVNAWVATP